MKLNRTVVAALLVLLAPLVGSADTLNGLYVYLQYQVISRNLAPNYWFFLPDGRYLNYAPEGGSDQAAFDAGCAKAQDACGTYTYSGGTLSLQPKRGKPWTTEVKQLPGGKLEINHIECTRISQQFAAGAKLDGRYSAGANYGGIMSARTYIFSPDGTFTAEAIGSARSSAASALSSSVAKGTYKLSGNTLELTENGQTSRHFIFEMPTQSGPQLMIDGRAWKKS